MPGRVWLPCVLRQCQPCRLPRRHHHHQHHQQLALELVLELELELELALQPSALEQQHNSNCAAVHPACLPPLHSA